MGNLKVLFLFICVSFLFHKNSSGQCVTPPSYDFTITPTSSWQTTNSSAAASGCKVYRIYMTTSFGYDFSLCSADGFGGTTNNDGDFTMYNSVGTQLWYIDGTSGCGYDASTLGSAYQNWTPPADGYYYLKIDDYSNAAITFTLAYKYSAVEMKVPSSGNNSYTVCSGNLYDFGGSAGDYSSSWNGYTVLNPSVAGNKIQISGTSAGEACCDYVRIYNGVGTGSTLLGTYYMGTAIPSLTSTDASGALTVLFYSDGSVNGAGFNITINCVSVTCTTPGTPTSVVGTPTGGTSANLSWAAGSPAGSATVTYYWVVGTSSTVTYGAGVAQGTTTTTSASTTALSCGTTYYLRVYANTSCNGTSSAYGTSASFTTTACEMLVPSSGNNSYTVCSGNLYDFGGSAGDYSSSWNGYSVINPGVAGNKVQLTGTTSGESCCDYLQIYNGSGTGGTLLGTYYMGTAVPLLTSTDAAGTLTVLFYSDGSVVGSGFNLTISCFTPCGTPAGTASATPTNLAPCTNTSLSLVGYTGTIQWQSSPDNTTWTNITGATSTPYITIVGGDTYFRAAVTSGCTSYSNSVLVSVTGSGTKYYVNNNSLAGDVWCTAIGNASNSGMSPCSPKTSLQDVFDNYDIEPGDTVFVDAGTYTLGLDITSADEGSAAGNVVITGAGIGVTIITAPAGDDNFKLTSVVYTKIRRMTLLSSEATNFNYCIYEGRYNFIEYCRLVHTSYVNVLYRSDGGVWDIDQNTVANCTIENAAPSGYNIWYDGDADNDTIRNCTITSTGTVDAKAFYLTDRSSGLSDMWPTEVRMFNNIVTADDYGVYANTSLGFTMEEFDIHNNTFNIVSKDKSDGAAIRINNHGISSSYYSNIYRNRINGGKCGIYLTDGADYINFYNNYIYASDIGIYVADDNSDENQLIHNSFYTTQQCAYFNGDSKAFWTCQNNIFYTTGDAGYECLYAGNNTSTFVLCDNNIYYAPNGANIAEYAGAKALYPTLAGWQGIDHHDGTGNGDLNSFYTNPNYQAPGTGDLDLVGNYKTGASVGLVTNDIYLTARTHPTIGAWEEGSTLPVDLLNFSAKCVPPSVELNWITVQEQNNDFFTIESSHDGINYYFVAKIYSTGNSNSATNYSYIDYNTKLNAGNIFYRLKQTDFDGKYSISDPVVLNCTDNNSQYNFQIINYYLNDNIEITYSGLIENSTYIISIIDCLGRELSSQKIIIDSKSGQIFINKSYLTNGIYNVVIKSENSIFTKQIVISTN